MNGKMRLKKRITEILRILLCAVFIVSGGLLFEMHLSDGNMQQYRKISSKNKKNVLINNAIDWGKLLKTNPDVYAWIEVPGTSIDYAIACASEEENFYLYHNVEKKIEFSGMIFSQKKNARDFSDPVTVLYGHNMRNGSMFADLNKYENPHFLNKHDVIYIYQPDRILVYKIFSAGEMDNRNILDVFDFSAGIDPKYIKVVKKNMGKKMQLKKTEHLLTLSTCAGVDTKRRVVHGKFVRKILVYKN
ncbi:MAG: class B sortase [Lachnospiraceae bacterium]|nr:class B sortase [Lachnospiraceae bacterium]MBP3458888.1 class B sortase [Lachnospiraceae bacterium]